MKLPVISGSEAVKAFQKAGYELDYQHGVTSYFDAPIRRTDASRFPTIRKLAKGTLRALIREAGLTVEEFARLP